MIYPLHQLGKWIQLAKRQVPLSPPGHQSTGHIHQILHDRSDAAPEHFPGTDTRQFVGIAFLKADLPDDPQHVVRQHRQVEDQTVAGKMIAWQALRSHIGFQFGVKLLAGAMIVIQPDQLIGR